MPENKNFPHFFNFALIKIHTFFNCSLYFLPKSTQSGKK